MNFLVQTLLPTILILGFISYFFKVYYHFLYLKILKKYPKNINFLSMAGFSFKYYFDRLETILPFIKKRKKINLSSEEVAKLEILEKRIFFFLIVSIIGFLTIPLGIYLQKVLA